MRRKERRSTPRYAAGWMARYSPDGQPSSWSRCEVVNVSEGGAGLILSGPPVEKDTRLTLELEMNDRDPLGGQVQGTVKHVSMTPDGTMHIGIEFAPDQAALVVLKITSELAPVLDAV
jgi:hypothetical protein